MGVGAEVSHNVAGLGVAEVELLRTHVCPEWRRCWRCLVSVDASCDTTPQPGRGEAAARPLGPIEHDHRAIARQGQGTPKRHQQQARQVR